MNEHEAYASLLADLARELLALYADDHDSIMLEWGYDRDEMKAFDSEVDRVSKRIDYLESKLKRAERTCHAEYHDCGDGVGGWYCSECGDLMDAGEFTNCYYCPNCGAKVVGDESLAEFIEREGRNRDTDD